MRFVAIAICAAALAAGCAATPRQLESSCARLDAVSRANFRFVVDDVRLAGSAASDSEVLKGVRGETFVVSRKIEVPGQAIASVRPVEANGLASVYIRFDKSGGRRFTDATRNGVGRRLALVVDGVVVMAANINEPVDGGSLLITSFSDTPSDSKKLADWISSAARSCRAP